MRTCQIPVVQSNGVNPNEDLSSLRLAERLVVDELEPIEALAGLDAPARVGGRDLGRHVADAGGRERGQG